MLTGQALSVSMLCRHPSADMRQRGAPPGGMAHQPRLRAPPPPPPDDAPLPHSPPAPHTSPHAAYMHLSADPAFDPYGSQAAMHGHFLHSAPREPPPAPAPPPPESPPPVEPHFVAPGSEVPPLHPIRQAAQLGEPVRAVMGDVLVAFEPPASSADPAAPPTSASWAQRYAAGDSLVAHFASYCGIDLRNPAAFVRQGNHDINVEHAFRCGAPFVYAVSCAFPGPVVHEFLTPSMGYCNTTALRNA